MNEPKFYVAIAPINLKLYSIITEEACMNIFWMA